MQTKESAEYLANIICNKYNKKTFKECFQSNKNSLCNKYGKCRIEEKSKEQLDYIISSIDENIYLEACPGSGKTEVLALKATYEISKWNRKGGMAFLTFTNEAASIIEERVNELNNSSKNIFPHFIGTLHSFIHGYISQPYGYKIINYENKTDKSITLIDENVKGKWLTAFKVEGKPLTVPIYANQLFINPIKDEITIKEKNEMITLNQYYNRADIQETIKQLRKDYKNPNYFQENFFKIRCKEAKNKFFKSGFATFDDMLYIAYQVLRNNTEIAKKIAQRFNIIFIDECQDLSETEIGIIEILRENGTKIHLIGDLNQAIYDYKNATPEITKKFIENKNFKIMHLSTCFRCNQSIVNVFQKIVKGPDIKGTIDNKLNKSCIFVDYHNITNDNLISWYNKYCDNILGQDSRRVILVRAKKFKKELLGSEETERIPSIIRDWNTDNLILRDEAMKLFGKEICSQINEKYSGNQYGCPHTIDNILVWKNFLASILNESQPLMKINTINKEWYAKAREILKPLIKKNYENYLIRYDEIDHSNQIKKITFNTPKNKGIQKIQLLPAIKFQFDNIQTIHSVKGQTFDSVILISNEKMGKRIGESWKEWLSDSQSEYARMAYVASSRPRKLLVWAVKNIKEEEIKQLLDLGFEKEDIDLSLLDK